MNRTIKRDYSFKRYNIISLLVPGLGVIIFALHIPCLCINFEQKLLGASAPGGDDGATGVTTTAGITTGARQPAAVCSSDYMQDTYEEIPL